MVVVVASGWLFASLLTQSLLLLRASEIEFYALRWIIKYDKTTSGGLFHGYGPVVPRNMQLIGRKARGISSQGSDDTICAGLPGVPIPFSRLGNRADRYLARRTQPHITTQPHPHEANYTFHLAKGRGRRAEEVTYGSAGFRCAANGVVG